MFRFMVYLGKQKSVNHIVYCAERLRQDCTSENKVSIPQKRDICKNNMRKPAANFFDRRIIFFLYKPVFFDFSPKSIKTQTMSPQSVSLRPLRLVYWIVNLRLCIRSSRSDAEQIVNINDNVATDHDILGFCLDDFDFGRSILFHKNIFLSVFLFF